MSELPDGTAILRLYEDTAAMKGLFQYVMTSFVFSLGISVATERRTPSLTAISRAMWGEASPARKTWWLVWAFQYNASFKRSPNRLMHFVDDTFLWNISLSIHAQLKKQNQRE